MSYNAAFSRGGLEMKTGRTQVGWLVAVLIVATLALQSLADAPTKAGDVNEARVSADSGGNDWLLNGRNFESHHFSPLKEITDQNARDLGLAWYLDVDSTVGIV